MIMQSIRWIILQTAVAAVALLVAAGGVQAQSDPPPPAQKTTEPDTSSDGLSGGGSSAPYRNLMTGGSSGIQFDATSNGFITGLAFDPTDQTLGATLSALSDVLRAHLNVPTGQGIVVESLRGDGPCALAGLKQYDVLLTLAGKPVASVDDLTKNLKAAGEKPVPLKLLRGGKDITIQVLAIYKVTLGPVAKEKKEYFIGISLTSMDEALRSQLSLSPGQGVVITEVIKDSPAEKAGVKVNDIVMEFGNQPIDAPEKLAHQVQADQDKPTTLKVLRAGKPLAIAITPAVREVKTGSADVERTARAAIRFLAVQDKDLATRSVDARKALESERIQLELQERLSRERQSTKQIEELREQVRSLQKAVERLNATLNNTPANPPKK